MIRCQRRQNSNSQQARKKNSSYISFLQEFQGTLKYCSLWFLNGDREIFSCYRTILFGLVFFKFSDPLWRKWKKNIQVFLFLTFGSADKACCLTSQIISSLWNWRHFSTLSSGTPTRTRIKLDEVEEFSDKLSSISCPYVFRVILPWCWLSENRKFESIKIHISFCLKYI